MKTNLEMGEDEVFQALQNTPLSSKLGKNPGNGGRPNKTKLKSTKEVVKYLVTGKRIGSKSWTESQLRHPWTG